MKIRTKSTLKQINCLILSLLLIFSTLAINSVVIADDINETIPIDHNRDRSIQWDVTMNFTEPGGKSAYVKFGEATDANDGPPADSYDMGLSPPPPNAYIRSWFDDGLGGPYTQLLKDYRYYPDTYKVWNLSVQWTPSDYVTPTAITISWDTIDLDNSEYDTVFLCDNVGSPLTDMLINNRISYDKTGDVFHGPAIHSVVFNKKSSIFSDIYFLGILNSKLLIPLPLT